MSSKNGQKEAAEAKKDIIETKKKVQADQESLRQAFNANGDLSRGWMREILDTDDLEDRLQEFQILLAQETAEFRVRPEVQHWLTVVKFFSPLSSLDAASRALVDPVAFTDGDFERGHSDLSWWRPTPASSTRRASVLRPLV